MSDKPDCFEDEHERPMTPHKRAVYALIEYEREVRAPLPLREAAEQILRGVFDYKLWRERPIVWPVGMIPTDWDEQ